jgi:hypothetical protein
MVRRIEAALTAPLSETAPSGTAKLSPDLSKPVPRWITSWPDWYGIHGNVQVVPASDYDALRASGTTRVREAYANGYATALETAAQVADEMDCAMLCGVGHEVGTRVRSLAAAPSPDDNEESK